MDGEVSANFLTMYNPFLVIPGTASDVRDLNVTVSLFWPRKLPFGLPTNSSPRYTSPYVPTRPLTPTCYLRAIR